MTPTYNATSQQEMREALYKLLGNEYFDNYMGEDVDLFKYCPYCGGEIEFSEV